MKFKEKIKLDKKIKEIIGQPVDNLFREVIKYTVINNCKTSLNIVDTIEKNGNMEFIDNLGDTIIKIQVKMLNDNDYLFFEKVGLPNVYGIVKNAFVMGV